MPPLFSAEFPPSAQPFPLSLHPGPRGRDMVGPGPQGMVQEAPSHLPRASRGNAVPRPSPVGPGPAPAGPSNKPRFSSEMQCPKSCTSGSHTHCCIRGPGARLGHQDTGMPGHWDTGTLGPRDTITSGHRDTETPGHYYTRTQGHRDTITWGHRDARTDASALSFPLGTRLEPGERWLLQHFLQTLAVMTMQTSKKYLSL